MLCLDSSFRTSESDDKQRLACSIRRSSPNCLLPWSGIEHTEGARASPPGREERFSEGCLKAGRRGIIYIYIERERGEREGEREREREITFIVSFKHILNHLLKQFKKYKPFV